MTESPMNRILVVDDQPENLLLLEEILTTGGYRVHAFPSGKLALDAAQSCRPDLVLLDIMMPGMDGFELYRQLQQLPELQQTPVIFISALHDTATKSKGLSLGGVDYITKPFLEEEVLARVATHVRISSQKKALIDTNARLRELEQARENYVQMLVHDLRSPLAGISMSLQTIRMETDIDGIQRIARQSLACIDQLKLMINTLLEYGRLEAHAMPLSPRSVSLASLLEDLRQSLPMQDCRLDIPEGLSAYCDPLLTLRILQNLLSNAFKYSPAESVCLSARITPQGLRLQVIDQGHGVPPEDHAHIFQKFGQSRTPGTRPRAGHGIGLAFCKLAAEAQGGDIGLESTPGHGTKFWFTLPQDPMPGKDPGP